MTKIYMYLTTDSLSISFMLKKPVFIKRSKLSSMNVVMDVTPT